MSHSFPIVLTSAQARVLGSLMEKEVTTPDLYPLSLNALANACNQRSSREPVMELDEDDLRQALHGLEDLSLAGPARSADGRVPKYEHRLGEAFNFSRAEFALLCVLLLRGPQTPGELRGRTDRLHRFDEIGDVLAGLQRLIERDPSLAVVLPRQPGTKEARYAHLLCGAPAQEPAPAYPAPLRESAQPFVAQPSVAQPFAAQQDRVAQLEADVAELQQQLAALQKKIEDLFA
ncbi:MAG TPA: YceH family protein [Terracidiphilus sp.]|nr:YceH family protein [Terracidiphilus sp.]